MQQLYLLRHGQSEANAHKQVTGSLESPLSILGKQQSTLAGQTIKQFYAFDLIVSSPMTRAVETAKIIAEQINLPAEKVVIINDLRERDLGSLEGALYAEVPSTDGNYEDAENAPGIEPIAILHNRAEHVLQQLATYSQNQILVVCHNGIGRMIKVAAQHGQPLDLYKQARLENAIVYPLLITPKSKSAAS